MSIPDKLLAVVRTQDITSKIPYSDLPYTAKAAFVVPAESTKMCEKARRWGEQPAWSVREPAEYTEVLLDNEPLTRLQLVGYTERAESGTCYKVITDHGWLVDFRSDEFMEAVFMGRIDGAGLIYGKYVWSQASGQMRLVLVDSPLYKTRLTTGKTWK